MEDLHVAPTIPDAGAVLQQQPATPGSWPIAIAFHRLLKSVLLIWAGGSPQLSCSKRLIRRVRRGQWAPPHLDNLLIACLHVELQYPPPYPLFFGGADQLFVQQLLQNLKLAQTAL